MTDVGTFYDVMGTADARIILDGFDPAWSDEQIADALADGHQGGRIRTDEERDRFVRSALMALPRCRADAWGLARTSSAARPVLSTDRARMAAAL